MGRFQLLDRVAHVGGHGHLLDVIHIAFVLLGVGVLRVEHFDELGHLLLDHERELQRDFGAPLVHIALPVG